MQSDGDKVARVAAPTPAPGADELMLDEFSPILHWLAGVYLAVAGWKIAGGPPDEPKYVLVAAPHTSNWDVSHMLAISFRCKVRVRWAGKHTLFRAPFRGVMRWLGGIPIDRRGKHGAVEQLAEAFGRTDRMVLAISPEGTRRRTEHWRSGFYHIARLAQVPMVCGALDYGTKTATFGPALWATGNIREDMDRLRSFFAGCTGCHPDQFGPVRLEREE
jgi:1-acyl-sn-glycerol-3-phosphate acyltransferase